ncbi:MAG: hypothetical protein LLF95_12365 [Bacteroidales bacterium]|nr:hypothetical protein [Bacteroidales bacterium]
MKRVVVISLTALLCVNANVLAEDANKSLNETKNVDGAVDSVKIASKDAITNAIEFKETQTVTIEDDVSIDEDIETNGKLWLDINKISFQEVKNNDRIIGKLDSLNNVICKMNISLNNHETVDSKFKQIRVANKTKLDKWKVIGLYSTAIVLNGIGDGLNNTHSKTMGHVFNAASIGVLLTTPFFIDYNKKKWYWYMLTYTSLRVSLFDITYNLTTKQPIEFIGSTAITDKMYKALDASYGVSKILSLAVGLTVPLKLL